MRREARLKELHEKAEQQLSHTNGTDTLSGAAESRKLIYEMRVHHKIRV